MTPEIPPANADTGLVDKMKQANIDMDALAEKIVALLRRELEIEAERCGKQMTGS